MNYRVLYFLRLLSLRILGRGSEWLVWMDSGLASLGLIFGGGYSMEVDVRLRARKCWPCATRLKESEVGVVLLRSPSILADFSPLCSYRSAALLVAQLGAY